MHLHGEGEGEFNSKWKKKNPLIEARQDLEVQQLGNALATSLLLLAMSAKMFLN